MSWIIAIIIGALIGWIASMIMKSESSLLWNIIIGILGSILGRWIFGGLLGFDSAYAAGGFSLAGIIWGVIGAIILIVILRALRVYR
ncbi:MAG: GlsB/YeaQ/YmgE family stress response membrane protein [Patescibacteria group bacterium]